MNPNLWRWAAASLRHRAAGFGLLVLLLALASAALMSVELLRQEARAGFARAAGSVDLIIGPRSGAIELLLQGVFFHGQPRFTLSEPLAAEIAELEPVAWTVPVALGDNVRGQPVVGTTAAFFQHFGYRDRPGLRLAQGRVFTDGAAAHEAVVGAQAAVRFGLAVGDTLVLAHGVAMGPGLEHDRAPFRVVGILAPTGLPVDRAVFVPIAALAAIHGYGHAEEPVPRQEHLAHHPPFDEAQHRHEPPPPTHADEAHHEHSEPNLLLVGLQQPQAALALARWIENHSAEPITVLLPSLALHELWQLLALPERALGIAAALATFWALAAAIGIMALMAWHRRDEVRLWRALGASGRIVLPLLLSETTAAVLLAAAVALALTQATVLAAAPLLGQQYGLVIDSNALAALPALALISAVAWLAGLVAVAGVYRRSAH